MSDQANEGGRTLEQRPGLKGCQARAAVHIETKVDVGLHELLTRVGERIATLLLLAREAGSPTDPLDGLEATCRKLEVAGSSSATVTQLIDVAAWAVISARAEAGDGTPQNLEES